MSEYDSAKSKIDEEPKMGDDSLTSPYDISVTSLDTQQKDIKVVSNEPPSERDVTKVDGNQNHYVTETENQHRAESESESSGHNSKRFFK